MNPENAVEVKNVTKGFKVYYDRAHTLKEMVVFRNQKKYENRIVLDGISFSIRKGEAVGLIGSNGCGKSTTLKLLTRIIYPDSGTIEMSGRVSSLLELGAGFHPDMSGKENIYINASIFGLTRKEIDARVEDIIAFSELEEFIDNPVRTYSSGMYMRLAFAVAIHVNAEILLIDEILAVGDANFQAKCFNKLREIKAEGTTIVIVSHSLSQIEQICDRSIWIQDGHIRAEGKPKDIHPEYMDFMGKKRQEISEREEQRLQEKREGKAKENKPIENKDKKEDAIAGEKREAEAYEEQEKILRWGNGKARITDIHIADQQGNKRRVFQTGEDIGIKVSYRVQETVKDAVFGIGIFRSDGLQCYGTNTRIDQFPVFDLKKSGSFDITLKNILLLPGKYLIDIAIESGMGEPVDYYREAASIELYSKISDVGTARVEHSWELMKE